MSMTIGEQLLLVSVFATVCCFTVFAIESADAAKVEIKITGEGIGSVINNVDRTWESGDNLDRVRSADYYNGGSAGHVALTAPSDFKYQYHDTTDAQLNNRYDSTSYLEFRNGGVFSDSLSMNDNNPNITPIVCSGGDPTVVKGNTNGGAPVSQTATIEYTGIMAGAAQIDSAKFVNDANMSAGQEARWDGAGLYTYDSSYNILAGTDNSTRTTSYATQGHDHFFASTNMSGGMVQRPEFSFTDFQDVFVTNSSSYLDTNRSVNLT